MSAGIARKEESIGLILAVAAHAALIALLVWHPGGKPVIPPPESMTVTLSGETGLTSTSPEPQAAPAPDVAPVLGEPAEPEALTAQQAEPVAKPAPLPVPQPQPKILPMPLPQPRIQPQAKPQPRIQPQLQPLPRAKPAPRLPATLSPPPLPRAAQASGPRTPARTASASPSASATASRPAGASRIGSDFLKGVAGSQASGSAKNPPAAAIGPAVQSALSGAISRQLKPHWVAPQGAEAEKLVTVLAWDLNRNGTLASQPRVVRQDGITDANRPQAARHAEQAIRAVQLSAPFNLPAEYFSAWQHVLSFRFDKRLSQ